MAKDTPDQQGSILGNIDPPTRPKGNRKGEVDHDETEDRSVTGGGGSQHDRTEHAGSRDVTEGTSGGTGTETGGSRNYRSGTGATGGDLGNRPE